MCRFKAAAELQQGGQDLSWGPSLGRGRKGNREGNNLGEGKDWGRARRAALQTQKREGRSGARGELAMGQWCDGAEIRSHGEEAGYSSRGSGEGPWRGQALIWNIEGAGLYEGGAS